MDYQGMIVRLTGATVEEAPLVEALMRVEHGTLNALSGVDFLLSARRRLLEVKDHPATAREVAKTYGLVRRMREERVVTCAECMIVKDLWLSQPKRKPVTARRLSTWKREVAK